MNNIINHIRDYIDKISEVYQTGKATEPSYRSALQFLLEPKGYGMQALNEPKRVEAGAPDFVVIRESDGLDIGWCEAKDIDIDIRKFRMSDKANREQKLRYSKGLHNLIYTNHLAFQFIRDGEEVAYVEIAEIRDRQITLLWENLEEFDRQLKAFLDSPPTSISKSSVLAEAMAGKAVLIRDSVAKTLNNESDENKALTGLYKAFQKMLIPNISKEYFADIYAETITYGLFAARYHQTQTEANPSGATFTRAKALELVPETNPFLKNLFQHIAVHKLDSRLRWIIDPLCAIYQVADLAVILKDFGRFSPSKDPFIDFYEIFLASYNPKKRKERGVWYTPAPAVDFIVRAVDGLLKDEFDLTEGLANIDKVTVDWTTYEEDENKKKIETIEKRNVHRVQILDPAVGTGTFLAAAVNKMQDHVSKVSPATWSNYVDEELIPRLHGFELLMASYAICHLKLNLVLSPPTLPTLRYKSTDKADRFSVYLTNSLAEGDRKQHKIPIVQWFADEANMANNIKQQTPIMCIIGNPPYRENSANKGSDFAWIEGLMADYKKEPDSQQRLQERNSRSLNDDYVKFIRFAQYMIEKNGEGILGFITNHGYLDNPTFRGMRWQLLNAFDKIWVLDLHGNANKKEASPDGSADYNIFDIRQGVAIIVAVKKKHAKPEEKPLAQLWHGELWSWGSRKSKTNSLQKAKLDKRTFTKVPLPTKRQPRTPQYLFVPRDYESKASRLYHKGFALTELVVAYAVGLQTARDNFTIALDKDELWQRVQDLAHLDSVALRRKYALGKEANGWQLDLAKRDVAANLSRDLIVPIAYRPFDTRWTYYTGNTKGFHYRPSMDIMHHMLAKTNIALCVSRQQKSPGGYSNVFVYRHIGECALVSNRSSEIGYALPLYLYPNGGLEKEVRINFDPKLYQAIRKAAEMSEAIPAPQPEILETARGDARADEVKVFDYIYAVLHCPTYRNAYKVFLKSDFPRVPLPNGEDSFAELSAQGERLRLLHLLDKATIGETPYAFEGKGDNKVAKVTYSTSSKKSDISEAQYFDNVPKEAWEMIIGGYQPAEKWLKDRKDCVLSHGDVLHYQRIIKVLSETARLMKQIKVPNLPTKS